MSAPDTTQPDSAVRPDAPQPVTEAAAVATDIGKGASSGQVLDDVTALAGDPEAREFVGEIPQVVQETKAGWKTTEFWGVVGAAFASVGPIDTSSKDKIILGGLAVLYAIARGIAKHGVPNITPIPPA